VRLDSLQQAILEGAGKVGLGLSREVAVLGAGGKSLMSLSKEELMSLID
jgi:hypothetical protein